MIPLPDYLVALVTPFTRRGDLDLEAHVHNVRELARRGVKGFVIGGSNGEGPYLEPGERARLVRAVRRRKLHLMTGIAGESTRVALDQVAEAADAGTDTVLVLTPTAMARGRDEAVARHYTTIAEASPIPVMIYSVPAVTAYSIPVDLVAKLARHRNIIGMKDSSGDVVRLQSLIDATPPEFLLYSGASRAITAAMAIGCRGAITGSGNYAPELVLETLSTAKRDPAEARRSQSRLSRLSSDVEAHGIPGVKAAARAAGLNPGYPRLPLARLPQGMETSIAKLMA